MKVWGLSEHEIKDVCEKLQINCHNFKRRGKAWQFQAQPLHSSGKYARRSGSGRRLKALCYHGFRDLILSLFAVPQWGLGPKRIKTAWGDWRSIGEFNKDLPHLKRINVGSQARPAYMIDLCKCKE